MYSLIAKEGDIMATRSFTDTYKVNKKDLAKLHDIIDKQPRVTVKKIKGHSDVKGSDIAKMLGLRRGNS